MRGEGGAKMADNIQKDGGKYSAKPEFVNV
jgi:hypothetical protein